MVEKDDPFENRLEDYLNKVPRAVVSLIPILGGPLGEVLSFVIGDPAQERRDQFMRGVMRRVIEIESCYDALRPENLAKNEAFQATFIQASQASLRTADAEKKELLRNAILNSAISPIDEAQRQMFVQYIDRMTVLHVSLLKTFDAPLANPHIKARTEDLKIAPSLTTFVEIAIPTLSGKVNMADLLVRELEAMGLTTNAPRGQGAVGKHGLFLFDRRTTNLGRSFLAFVSEPAV